MKLDEFSLDQLIRELVPPTGTAPMAPAGVATANPMASGTAPAAGLAGGQMDPAQAAMAAKQRAEQKKQIQDQIKDTEKQLMDLKKKLAELG